MAGDGKSSTLDMMITHEEELNFSRWATIETPIVRLVVAAFSSERLGEEPGELPRNELIEHMAAAFPRMTKRQLSAAASLGLWGARNVIIENFPKAPWRIAKVTDELAELAGGDEATLGMADHLGRVLPYERAFSCSAITAGYE